MPDQAMHRRHLWLGILGIGLALGIATTVPYLRHGRSISKGSDSSNTTPTGNSFSGPSATIIRSQEFSISFDPQVFRAGSPDRVASFTQSALGEGLAPDIAPAHTAYVIHYLGPQWGSSGFPKSKANLAILPLQDRSVSDYEKEYPGLRNLAEQVLDRCRTKHLAPSFRAEWPIWNSISAQTIHAKTEFIETPWMEGLFYLTYFSQEQPAMPITRGDLEVIFIGVSKDGQYLINFRGDLIHDALPAQGSQDVPAILPSDEGYIRSVELTLNGCTDGSFRPDLGAVKAMLHSLRSTR